MRQTDGIDRIEIRENQAFFANFALKSIKFGRSIDKRRRNNQFFGKAGIS